MVNRMYLFIEGAKDTTNGDLREGFRKLLEKKAKGKMPTISMGEGKLQTIDKFKNSINSKLLCDLDDLEEKADDDLAANELTQKKEFVFFMIQEMEAWFISQPDILDEFYNTSVSSKLAQKSPQLFVEPDKELQKITKSTKKGIYHKVRHGSQLLKLLNADKLYEDFKDFKRLVDSLK